ncbi:MAG: Ldh family oxidoreductase, partial [Usitatibacter sp.]
MNTDAILVDFGRLRYFIALAFETVGMPPEDSRAVAGLMAEADLQGSDGHGVIRLPQYVKRIRAGGINLHPDIRVVKEKAAMALINGDNAMGHLVMKRAAEL